MRRFSLFAATMAQRAPCPLSRWTPPDRRVAATCPRRREGRWLRKTLPEPARESRHPRTASVPQRNSRHVLTSREPTQPIARLIPGPVTQPITRPVTRLIKAVRRGTIGWRTHRPSRRVAPWHHRSRGRHPDTRRRPAAIVRLPLVMCLQARLKTQRKAPADTVATRQTRLPPVTRRHGIRRRTLSAKGR